MTEAVTVNEDCLNRVVAPSQDSDVEAGEDIGTGTG
jgi:hypothetical protein